MNFALLLALSMIVSGAPGQTTTNAPRVSIKSPRGGWTSQRIASIRGTVTDRKLKAVHVLLNGVSRTVNAEAGYFEAHLPVRPGPNSVEAIARSSAGTGHDRTSFFANVGRTDLQILLTWDTAGTDLDLHVTEPNGEQCYHGNRQTSQGGVLEVDDIDGFGPEIYLLPRAPPGTYRIAVAYYDAGRAAQTEATVEVILWEGSGHEQRHYFPITLTHMGQILEVGSFVVDRPLE